MKSFYVVVTDIEQGKFSISGPMNDDTNITARVCEALDKGRKINCSSAEIGMTKDEVRISIEKSLKLKYSECTLL
ncbi:hypothetical protein ACU5DF_02655 [Aliivibrio wodanis]|uniref:hypothetical protein n=1 Tax=Aliivibrio wodanis TaxID=80852 RepID=UPI00406D359E